MLKPFSSLYKKYPYIGTIERWVSDRGFGFIILEDFPSDYRGINRRASFFAHISHREGPKKPRGSDFSEQRCLLAVGFDPQKPERFSAIQWITEDEIDGAIDSYRDSREEAISSWGIEELVSALKAKWYINDIWKGSIPKSGLPNDQILLAAVDKKLSNPQDPLEYYSLLCAKVESPFFFFTNDEKEAELRQGISTLIDKHPEVFQNCDSQQLSTFVSEIGPEFSYLLNPVGKIIFGSQSVAIDIESDGEILFQVGYAKSDQSCLIEVKDNKISAEEACKKLNEEIQSSWIVGHNLLEWDLPTLSRISLSQSKTSQVFSNFSELKNLKDHSESIFSRNHGIWDTLLISTLLEPWKVTHALSTSIIAHRADSDALATLELFHKQVGNIPLDYMALINNEDEISPIDLLILCGSAILRGGHQKYPEPPSFLVDVSASSSEAPMIILPEIMLSYCYWVSGVRYDWPEGYSNSNLYYLSASRVEEEITSNSKDNIFHVLLLQILKNAESNSIQVLVQMLPYWLRIKCRDIINRCATISDQNHGKTKWRLTTYEACSMKSKSAEKMYLEGRKIFPEIGRLSFLEKTADLSTRELEGKLKLVDQVDSSYQLRRLNDEQSKILCGADFNQNGKYWIEKHPIRRRQTKNWSLWCTRHISHNEEERNESIEFNLLTPDVFTRPRWLDENTGTPVGIDNIWPSSANRSAYWRDLIYQINSLLHSDNPASSYILLLENDIELGIAKRLFSELSFSLDEESTIAQQLLAAKRGKKICAVDSFENLAIWKQTAFDLDCPVHFIIASIPLSLWLMCLSTTNDILGSDDDNVDEDSDESMKNDPTNSESEKSLRFPFTNEDVEEAISQFLAPWLKTYFEDCAPTILDYRLNIYTSKIKCLGRLLDVIWHPLALEETDVFNRYMEEFGQLERRDPPSNYEKYEEFLDKNWRDHENPWRFKDTQKPAIQAICNSQSDLLVKLPTGEGKSIIFQVPALLRGDYTKKLTIVISPLRALMRDQVVSLWKKGFFFSVDYLSSDRDPWETSEVYQGILDNTIKLLYIAPERFRVSRFRDALERRYNNDGGLEFVVVDETHCVSQWGFEFRPDYFFALEEINRLYRSNSSPVRVLMFSATVTRAVEGDLREILGDKESDSLLVCPESYQHPIQNHIRLNPEEVPVALYGKGWDAKIIARTGDIQNIIEKADPDTNKSVVMVFVTRRDHAEAIAASLIKNLTKKFRIEYFHAGMPPNERLRIYESVKNCAKGGANVLVATKAFGMGMDIPNIHWCIHLAPPSFLEDYLQEVGRTGRGRRERDLVGLEHIDCTLLYHPDDFSRNHELVRRNMIHPPDLVMLWTEIAKRSAISSSNERICILPTDGYKEMNGNRLKLGLSWLEREPPKRLSILGYLPDMLKVTLNQDVLEQCAKTDDSRGVVAKALLRIFNPPSIDDIQGGIWSFLKKFVGFIFSSPDQQQNQNSEAFLNQESRIIEAEVNLGAILSQARLSNVDELYRALFALQEASAITIERDLKFTKGSAADKSNLVWRCVDALVGDLIGKAFERGREVLPEEIMQIVFEAVEVNESGNQKRRSMAESTVRATIRLINASGLRIREQLNEEHDLVYRYTLSKDLLKIINWRIKSHIKTARELEILLKGNWENPVNLGELLKLLGTSRRLRDLRTALKLLADLSLYSSEQSLFCYSYILELNTNDSLHDKSSTELKPSDNVMYEQLEKVNRLSELRSFSMEMFARLLTDEERRRFIDEYFQVETPQELEDLLGRAAGGIDDPNVPEELQHLISRVRQEAITKALDRFRLGEEPEQYKVCSHPWNRNLLVNAGPGAGKTEVLMMRAAHLIHQQGISPEQVLILAFNRAVVHEIKARIKRLFDELGYGAFVRRLKVRTFHSFALEHLGQGEDFSLHQVDNLDQIVTEFSNRCVEDIEFAQNVISGIRAILVDEFQDMNDARYGMLEALIKAANTDPANPNTGIMVIGDDDQDILRWDRIDNPVEAHEYFGKFTNDFEPVDVFNLRINFRSSPDIVIRSQRFIDNVLSNVTTRMKTDIVLSARQDAEPGKINDRFNRNLETILSLISASRDEGRTCAILCRTNYETSRLYEELCEHAPEIQIQGRDNLKLARLRHVGTWLDVCRQSVSELGNQMLDDELKRAIQTEYRKSVIPEIQNPTAMISFLWDSVLEENPGATLEYFITFIEELRTDDYIRMLGKTKIPKWVEKRENEGIGKTLISTIHKVKGLEFDNMIIVPSKSRFPFNSEIDDTDLGVCQADEARLFYVAMTRAKRQLSFLLGEREKNWIRGRDYNGETRGIHLNGSPAEVFLGWPGFNDNRQEYLRTQIPVGSTVTLRRTANSIAIHHGNTRIGFLARATVNRISASNISNSSLRVQSIYRYPITEEIPDTLLNDVTQDCKNQGWFYTILVTGSVH